MAIFNEFFEMFIFWGRMIIQQTSSVKLWIYLNYEFILGFLNQHRVKNMHTPIYLFISINHLVRHLLLELTWGYRCSRDNERWDGEQWGNWAENNKYRCDIVKARTHTSIKINTGQTAVGKAERTDYFWEWVAGGECKQETKLRNTKVWTASSCKSRSQTWEDDLFTLSVVHSVFVWTTNFFRKAIKEAHSIG